MDKIGMDARTNEGAKVEDHAVGDGVEDVQAVFAAAQDACSAEQAEVFGDVGLRGTAGCDERHVP